MKKTSLFIKSAHSTDADQLICPPSRRPPAIGIFWLILGIAFGITGCASSGGSTSAPATKPSMLSSAMQALGLQKPPALPDLSSPSQDQQVPLHLFTAENLNAGAGDQPLALVVKIYQLRSAQRFQQIPFDDFVDGRKDLVALGNDLINNRETLVLPNQHYDSVETMPGTARYIGVVALFRSPAAERWRFTYDVKKSTPSGITLGLHACALSSTSGSLVTELSDNANSLASVHCAILSP